MIDDDEQTLLFQEFGDAIDAARLAAHGEFEGDPPGTVAALVFASQASRRPMDRTSLLGPQLA